MAKKKKPIAKQADKTESAFEPPPFDRRAMERDMRKLVAELEGTRRETTPLDRAQDIMYRAFEASGAEQVRLAQQALEISSDCADAYVVLAEHAKAPGEAQKLFEQGMAAAERALGKQAFAEHEGHFWGVLETRPYMRARQGLAQCLWEAGRRDEAAGHYREMLRLNPGDNQGNRYALASLFLDMERHDDLRHLLAEFEDDASAVWAYTKALVAFREEGGTAPAKKLLMRAVKANQHAPAYLLAHKQLPRDLPPYISLGGDDEAVTYAAANRRAWLNTPGAISWLRQTLDLPLPAAPTRRPSWPQLKLALRGCPQEPDEVWQVDAIPRSEDLLALPREPAEVWQADIRPMPAWITGEGQPYRPWVALVLNRTDDFVLAHQVSSEQKPAEWLWETVLQAIGQPAVGEPHRPGTIEVSSVAQREALLPHLEPLDIECVALEQLEPMDAALDSMAEHLGDQGGPPSLLDAPGMGPAQVGSFYAAAADFYRRKPWQRVPGDTVIEAACDKFQSGPWYAVVMGQSGVQQGLAIYEDRDSLEAVIAGGASDEESARSMSVLSMMFSEAFEISVRDLAAAERHGWTVAGPEAYPMVLRINPGMAIRPPLVWELELLEGCLRAIPEFLAEKTAASAKTVAVASGELTVRLSSVQQR
jgi:tetratricopeptide (TPR) repeat protein